MRMMKNNNNETVMVIGIDHGYGNMKTATRCFPSGVARYDKEPIFQNNLLVYNGMYYQIGEEHKEFCAEKTQDEDYYVLTLAAIARKLDGKGMNRATVHIAAGLPLTWVATQKEDFQKYLLQNECVDFTFRNKDYEAYRKQKEAEKQLQSLKYQAEQNRKIAEKEVQKLKKRIKLQSEKINDIKFFCGIGYIVAFVLSACLVKMCFL